MTQSYFEFEPVPHNGVHTSIEAAESMEPHAPRLRTQVLSAIKETGGSTCDELEVKLGLIHQCCSARIRELALGGHIVDSGSTRLTRRRRKAIVWVVK